MEVAIGSMTSRENCMRQIVTNGPSPSHTTEMCKDGYMTTHILSQCRLTVDQAKVAQCSVSFQPRITPGNYCCSAHVAIYESMINFSVLCAHKLAIDKEYKHVLLFLLDAGEDSKLIMIYISNTWFVNFLSSIIN